MNVAPFELKYVRLLQCECKQPVLRGDALPKNLRLPTHFEIKIDRAKKQVDVEAACRLLADYEPRKDQDTEGGDAPLNLSARFVANFSCGDATPSDDPSLVRAVVPVGMNVLWPYWRIFVQSMTQQMGLPALVVPLMDVSQMIDESFPIGEAPSPQEQSRQEAAPAVPRKGRRKSR